MASFDGRVALITGGALGIGRGIAQAFVDAGARVAILDIDGRAADVAAEELRSGGATVIAIQCDVARSVDVAAAVVETMERFGRIDVLVNNAGIQPATSYHRVEDTPEEIWDRILGVNLRAMYLTCKHALPMMRAGGGGVVVNMSSVQGLQSMLRVPAYAASKGAILALTRNVALDYAADGIRCVAICPGTIDSDMVRKAARAEGGDLNATLRRYGSFHPIGRLGHPDDIAAAVLFLASDEAGFITGEYLTVDGGFMALGAWSSSTGSAASS